MVERLCEHCGKPVGDREFFTVAVQRHWMHYECMLERIQEIVASAVDDHDGRSSADWVKAKNPQSAAVRREASEDRGRRR